MEYKIPLNETPEDRAKLSLEERAVEVEEQVTSVTIQNLLKIDREIKQTENSIADKEAELVNLRTRLTAQQAERVAVLALLEAEDATLPKALEVGAKLSIK